LGKGEAAFNELFRLRGSHHHPEGTYRPEFKSTLNLFYRRRERRNFPPYLYDSLINPLQEYADENLLLVLEENVKGGRETTAACAMSFMLTRL
jgi:hypothetical protein